MEAPVLRCAACGALLPPGALKCGYCQAVVSTVSCPGCFGLVEAHASFCCHCGGAMEAAHESPSTADLDCPQCKVAMELRRVGGHELAQCATCGGTWMEHERFHVLSSERVEKGRAIFASGAQIPHENPGIEAIRYRPCPVCKAFMNRINFGKHSGVILDTCKHHGLWFDPDELRKVLAFIESGGLAQAEAGQAAADHEAQRAMARVQMEASLEQARSGSELDLNVDLGELLGKIFRWGRGI